jgi:electron transport complex protein RnfC
MPLSFRGGIRPPDNKDISADSVISNLAIPHLCSIPLKQHSGTPVQPVVRAGNFVSEGQLIGVSNADDQADIHASIPGKIIDIRGIVCGNMIVPAVIIEAEGSFSASSRERIASDWTLLSPEEILLKIKESGIVGLGGEGHPTKTKLSSGPGTDLLIVNATESEPYRTSDFALLSNYPTEIIKGALIVIKALGASKIKIALSKATRKTALALKKAVRETGVHKAINVSVLSPKYPQGSEKQLVYRITGREIPRGASARDFDVTVFNASTLYAVYEAVVFSKPLYERVITVTGRAIKKPGNYKIRIGTRISDIINDCGGLIAEPAAMILGGPMKGTAVSADEPVIKTTGCVLFLTADEARRFMSYPCMRCGRCVTACPAGLVPAEMGDIIEENRADQLWRYSFADCIECGSCDYVCPSGRRITELVKRGKDLCGQQP